MKQCAFSAASRGYRRLKIAVNAEDSVPGDQRRMRSLIHGSGSPMGAIFPVGRTQTSNVLQGVDCGAMAASALPLQERDAQVDECRLRLHSRPLVRSSASDEFQSGTGKQAIVTEIPLSIESADGDLPVDFLANVDKLT